MADEYVAPPAAESLDRIARLLWELPVGVAVRWCPDARYTDTYEPAVDRTACVYLGRRRDVRLFFDPPNDGVWLAVVSVQGPLDAYVELSEKVRARVARVAAADGKPIEIRVGRGEFGV